MYKLLQERLTVYAHVDNILLVYTVKGFSLHAYEYESRTCATPFRINCIFTVISINKNTEHYVVCIRK